ncbi:DNA glycosylase AlkZ-like family protein [Kitasatospora sp. NPDC057223]|uniref:DNA glycosylase AlkZ-like family protein n=1 Tax=Kitasatospora sp. NPDC057223 TaxID=3346055 RepID=UPI003637FA54
MLDHASVRGLRARAQALAGAELARRYVRARAPVGVDDFATWSGLPVTLARSAWKMPTRTDSITEYGALTVPTERMEELRDSHSARPNAVRVALCSGVRSCARGRADPAVGSVMWGGLFGVVRRGG